MTLKPFLWSPRSWEGKPNSQQILYKDTHALADVTEKLCSLPPLVYPAEIERLKHQLADVEQNGGFVLQGGPCAETFSDCRVELLAQSLRLLLRFAKRISMATERGVVCIGRFAGQYAKSRSSLTETRGGVTLPNYCGDLVNRVDFSLQGRQADPERLLAAYHHAAHTLNFVRALTRDSTALDGVSLPTRAELFTSHEGLHLGYESAQTRANLWGDGVYDCTAHLLWIGERTHSLDGAHVEFFRGVRNPIGIKLGPRSTPQEVLRLLERLNPADEPGKILLITRLGIQHVEEVLPRLLEGVRASGRRALWICDPMHGNTRKTSTGVKTRRMEDLEHELHASFRIHASLGSSLRGVHLELTGENVTECLGRGLHEKDLSRSYRTQCDPRLNAKQTLALSRYVELCLRRFGSP